MGLYDQDRDFVGYGRRPPRAVWPDEARVVINVGVAYEEGSELSHAAGDGRNEALGEFATPIAADDSVRDYCTESIYEYGSRVGFWRLANIIDSFEIPYTLYGCSVAFELNPEVAQYVRESSHDVCCHGWRWEDVSGIDRETEKQHMEAAIASIERTCGRRPRGWFLRCIPSAHTRELVVEEGGFLYDSQSYNDELPYFVEVKDRQHLVIPYSFAYNDMRFILPGYSDPSSFFEYCKRGLDLMWDEGATHPKIMSVGVHGRWMGQAARASALRDFLEYAKEKGQVWFARREDIAQWWIDHHESFER
jgi:peptidoglycan/xylan/chitin deacetylase (PgdA/CDA1 family)